MKTYTIFIPLFVVITFIGCSQSKEIKNEHAHEESLQLTSYSNDFEVFAEATPFVVGHTSDILAHFSHLKDFKPLDAAKVTVSLVIGSDDIRQTLDKPTRTGIYLFQLKPEKAGSGKLTFDIETANGTSHILVSDIVVYTDEHDAQHAAADAAKTSSNGAVFTKEQSWKIDFATAEVKKEPFGQIIKTTAQILPASGDERIIVAKAAGIVAFSGESIIDGKAIHAGQSLFSIESSSMADNNLTVRYQEIAAQYNRTKAEYERKKELAKERIVSESDLSKAQSEFATAEALYNNLKKNFSAGKQSVSSPISGFVKQMLVRNGEYVETGEAILSVSQNRALFIKAELQPKYFPLLGSITGANIHVLNGKTYSLEELNGKVVSYGKSSDISNPLIPVTFQVNNNVDLLSGSFIEMYIKTQTNARAITVPNEAIVEEMGNYFVFAQLTPELFEKRSITKGATDGFYTEILSGIEAGERVVSKGAILVKLAQAAGALDAHSGHVH